VPLTSLLSNKVFYESSGLQPEKPQHHKHPCTDLASQHLIHALLQLWVTLQQPQLKKEPALLQPFQQVYISLLLNARGVIETARHASQPATETLNALQPLILQATTLADSVWALNPVQPPKQMQEFLQATVPLEGTVFQGVQGRIVVHPTMAQHPVPETLLREELTPLYYNQITQWFASLRETLHYQATRILASDSSIATSAHAELVTDVLGIRLFGSGYYLYLMVLFLTQQMPAARFAEEPSLFQALNYFDASTSQTLWLHQNFTSLHPTLTEAREASLTPLLKLIESHTQTSRIATAKDLANALALQEKFHQGILPGTLQLHDTTELWEKMNTLGLTQESDEATDYNALHEQQAIYQLLPHINEAPVTERDIILAAWLYRFDTASECIENALIAMALLHEDGTGTEEWSRFCNHLHASELRTIKALETSRLHRMLFVPSASLPLGMETQERHHAYIG
jgi:hypothetical protein